MCGLKKHITYFLYLCREHISWEYIEQCERPIQYKFSTIIQHYVGFYSVGSKGIIFQLKNTFTNKILRMQILQCQNKTYETLQNNTVILELLFEYKIYMTFLAQIRGVSKSSHFKKQQNQFLEHPDTKGCIIMFLTK